MTITELLTPRARRELPAERQLDAWCSAHGLRLTDLAQRLSGDQAPTSIYTALWRLTRRQRPEHALRAALEAETGIPAAAWDR